MADSELEKPKTLRHLLMYLGAGAVMLGYSTKRASEGRPVWPGFTDGAGKPPGAPVGAAETVLFWPAAAWFYATKGDAKPAAPTTPPAAPTPTDQ